MKMDTLCTQLVILAGAVHTMSYFLTMFSTGKIRMKVFNKEFMAQFDEGHQKALGVPAPVGGHPDDGNGQYAAKLSYADWYEFNNWNRAHLNFLETFMPVAVMTGITCLKQPLWACICAWLLVIGRIAYMIGYHKKGPKGRVCGAIIVDLALLGVFVGAFVSIFQWEKGSMIALPSGAAASI